MPRQGAPGSGLPLEDRGKYFAKKAEDKKAFQFFFRVIICI